MNEEAFTDLERRGFVHIPGFLSPEELEFLRDDFRDSEADINRNYNLRNASAAAKALVMPHVEQALTLVHQQTPIRVDTPAGAVYFATGVAAGVDFPWHQDHESYFIFQNHYDYLNFYMPIVKPDVGKSNVSLVPFDVMERESPKAHKVLLRSGAMHFESLGADRCLAVSDETGAVRLLPTKMEPFAFTPKLAAGDLLLMRGDMVHRTQDTDTARVALSIRMASGATMIKRSRLASGGVKKALMMSNYAIAYQMMFKAFDEAQTDELPFNELHAIIESLELENEARRRDFLKQLLREKRRAHVLSSFVMDAPVAAGLRGWDSAKERVDRARTRLSR